MNDIRFPKVSIIILNYNGWKDTITCLESVFNINYKNYYVVIVDNGSSDNSILFFKKWAENKLDSVEHFPVHPYFHSMKKAKKPVQYIEKKHEEYFLGQEKNYIKYQERFIINSGRIDSGNNKLVIIRTNKNLGYAGGNNLGLRYSLKYLNTEYFLILNNDTVVNANIVSKLLEIFHKDEKVGMCGPVEYSYKDPNKIQSAGGRFGLYTGIHDMIKKRPEKRVSVDWICGSCMLLKRDIILNIGYFDERFFLYAEEVDYAYRVKKNRYKTVISPETCIWHKGGKNNGYLYLFFTSRNRLLFSLKHLNGLQLLIFIPIHITKWIILRPLLDLLLKKGKNNFFNYIRALKQGYLAKNRKIRVYMH
ncbi:glycosyltransferase family 2 protein [Thermodesulfobacteriota bacterium]